MTGAVAGSDGECPTCGAPLGPEGVCAACILRLALAPRGGHREVPAAGAVAAPAATTAPWEAPPEEFGDYRILGVLGEGAMGVVYRARKLSLRKDVAIKFIRAGRSASESQRALFLREAELASRLEHPNIVGVSEVGERDGVPFLVMRFIDGRPLSERLAEPGYRTTVRERVVLLREIARAVDHGHQRGVIHRDIKPGNILIDADGTPFVGDFGLARWVAHDSTVTYGEGVLIGTPAFMPPEQAAGRRADLTLASDVWSLGVVLYLLISGRLPFAADSLPAIVHRVVHDDPFPPFAFLVDAAAAGPVTQVPPAADAGALSRAARRDLDGICQRCLAKEPGRRYPTAGALAGDLERWLEGRPVEARPSTAVERLVRWTRRRPAVATALAAAALAMAAFASSAWQRQINLQTEKNRRLFNYVADMNLAQRGLQESNAVVFHRALRAVAPGRGETDLRGIELGMLRAVAEGTFESEWFDAGEPLLDLAVAGSAGQVEVAAVGTRHLFLLQGGATAQVQRSWVWSRTQVVAHVGIRGDGAALAVGDGEGLHLIPADGGAWTQWATGTVLSLAWSRDDRRLAAVVEVAGASGDRRVVVVEDGRATSTAIPIDGHTAIGWSESGELRFANSWARIEAWDPGGPPVPVTLVPGSYYCPSARFSHDADLLLRTSMFGSVDLVRVRDRKPIWTRGGWPATGMAAAFSPDDRRVALTTVGGAVQVFGIPGDSGEPRPEEPLLAPGHSAAVSALAFGGDGRTVYSAGRDGTIRRMVPGRPIRPPFLEVPHQLVMAAGIAPTFSPDGRWAALLETRSYGPGSAGDSTLIWDGEARRVVGRLPSQVVDWDHGGRVLTWDRDGRLRMWDLNDPSKPGVLSEFRLNAPHPDDLDPQLAEGGRWVVSVGPDGVVAAFEVATGRVRRLEPGLLARGPGTEAARVDFTTTSPATAFVIVGVPNRGTALWDIRRSRVTWLQEGIPADARFSPDGSQVAVTDYAEHRLRLFDGRTGRPGRTLPGHLGTVSSVAFTPDGRQLVTGGEDYMLVVWNLATQREVFRTVLDAPIAWLRVSPDARWLVVGHLPGGSGARPGEIGPGQYRLWSLGPLPPGSMGAGREPLAGRSGYRNDPTTRDPAPGTIWVRHAELARSHPVPPQAPGKPVAGKTAP